MYQGVLMDSVPSKYLIWCLRNVSDHPELIPAIRSVLQKRRVMVARRKAKAKRLEALESTPPAPATDALRLGGEKHRNLVEARIAARRKAKATGTQKD